MQLLFETVYPSKLKGIFLLFACSDKKRTGGGAGFFV
jgi:hypothetical protein